MIYWTMTPGTTMVTSFPNSYGFAAAGWEETLVLVIRNDTGRWVIDGEWGDTEVTANYFINYWDLPEDYVSPFPQGEYTYLLLRGWDGPIVSEGIIIIGDYKAQREENEQTIYYEQYGQEIGI